jgi:AGZA family xanthine/uracil permease-like MFS transporter
MLANGLASMLGCLMGNPFPVTVYVGHAGWKAMGASIGYTLASGVTMFIVPLFGLGAFMLAIIPMTAIVPILVFIGVVTANQVVRETPKVEVPVIFICLFPWIANWALTMMNSVMGRRAPMRRKSVPTCCTAKASTTKDWCIWATVPARQHALGLYRHLRHHQ